MRFKKRYKIWIEDRGETMEDSADDFDSSYSELQYVAEEYAEYYHHHRDGWENTWPITFSIGLDGKHLGDVLVERESRPYFNGTKIK